MKQRNKTTNKRTAKKAVPNGKLNDLTTTNGKCYEKSLEVVKKLEELLDVKQTNPFGTQDARIFKENLSTMNLSDMQSLAVRSGIFPNGNQTILKQKLVKAFKAEGFGTVNAVVQGNDQVSLDPSNPKHKEIIDYLKG
jgi:hypothetical protein